MTRDYIPAVSERRYDIDWLRSLAFLLLILYHVGMYYVADWGWHVKSEMQSEGLQNLMLLTNQWRMPLLFFLSGLVLSLVEPKMIGRKLLKLRSMRLLLPLIIGMYFIVPPQLYFELKTQHGFEGSYLSFLVMYWDPTTEAFPDYQFGAIGLLTWNHLWYLAYLWAYTLVYLLLRRPLFVLAEKIAAWPVWAFALVPILILTVWGYWLKPLFPKTHDLFFDWYNHALYFSIFFFGYTIAKGKALWEQVIQRRHWWCVGAALGYGFILSAHHDWWPVEAVLSWPVGRFGIQILVYANVWLWILALLALAGRHLRLNSPVLQYLNKAVLPWYILHQTVTIILAMAIKPYSLGSVLEPPLLIIGTLGLCMFLYEGIRRVSLLRVLFGLPKLNNDHTARPLYMARNNQPT